MSIKLLLNERVAAALQKAGAPEGSSAAVARSKQAKFGDYQANGVMGAAKKLGCKPRELGERVIAELDLEGIASRVELAGPGFINLFVDDTFLAKELSNIDAMCTAKASDPALSPVVVDYSSPNLAKEMHVGHIRSTVIGDAVVRILEFLGETVVRQNHMGDWGTQFGMLIAELESVDDAETMALSDLEGFYQRSKSHFDSDPDFAQKARDYVVRLQSGDEHCVALWRRFIDVSVSHSDEVYKTLGVSLEREHIMAESAYNDKLAGVVEQLSSSELAVDDNGAKVVFIDELADKEGKPSPFIIQKSGGGFLYATTDIAALDYRCNTLHSKRLMYFIDARQSLHMKQLFAVGRLSGIAQDTVSLEHHAFGTIMGKDGKPFKTRSGGTVKLADLLQESVDRAAELLAQRESDLSADEQADIARKVGIGAIKYADLSKTRTNDYIFDWETMLSFEGNTAPYLQYAYSRIQSIFRKAETDVEGSSANEIVLSQATERELALLLLQFGELLEQVAQDAYPHVLCTYLYELSSAFMSFYEACPILKSDVDANTRASRLALAARTAQVLSTGLDLLGIDVMERM